MKTNQFLLVAFFLFCMIFSSCDTFDVSQDPIPQFVNHDFIELSKVKRISKFRSSVGHSYTDSFEECRSMKHYYSLTTGSGMAPPDSSNVYSPLNGTIEKVFNEQNEDGIQLWIKSSEYKAFNFAIFHIITNQTFKRGMKVQEGELLGKTASTDIAVFVNQLFGIRYVSYFEVMSKDLFETYTQKGINKVSDMIITKEERDANPCRCNGEEFLDAESGDDWVILN